jgi:hypothetical protein
MDAGVSKVLSHQKADEANRGGRFAPLDLWNIKNNQGKK